jgi:hypothetical protein
MLRISFVSKSKRLTSAKLPKLSADRHELSSLMRRLVSLREQVAQAELRLIGSQPNALNSRPDLSSRNRIDRSG